MFSFYKPYGKNVRRHIIAAQAQRRGFTLTEISIVLSLVGFILSSVWVAAAHVYQQHKIHSFESDVTTIVLNAARLYYTQHTLPPTKSDNSVTDYAAGVFPNSWMAKPGNNVVSPFGGVVQSYFWSTTDTTGLPLYYYEISLDFSNPAVSILPLTSDTCINLLNHFSHLNSVVLLKTDNAEWSNDATATNGTVSNFTINDAATACQHNKTLAIGVTVPFA